MIKKNIFIAPVRLELIFLQFEASELTKLLNLFLKRDLTFGGNKTKTDVGWKNELPSNMICRPGWLIFNLKISAQAINEHIGWVPCGVLFLGTASHLTTLSLF